MALLGPRHPGPYITLYGLKRPYKALLGNVSVAVAVAVLILFRYLSNGGGSRKLYGLTEAYMAL